MKIKARVVGRTKIDPDQLLTLDHVRVSAQDYSSRTLVMFTAIGSRLEQCRFNNARIGDASFGAGREMSEYIECTFDGLHFDFGGGNARFVRCSFRDVYIREWLCQSTELIDCTFSGRINWAAFCGRIPIEGVRRDLHRERNEFHGNDFSNTQLIDPDFSGGIDLTKQRLPSGPEYLYIADAVSAVARLRAGLDNCNFSPEARRHALISAHIFDLVVGQGQKQLFLRPEAHYRLSEEISEREALDTVFALLRNESQPTPD
jgi:uncharacterized protein YjbI with pentapeptide repeats